MKKIPYFFIFCFIIFPFNIYAEFIYAKYGFEEINFGDDDPIKKPFQIKDRRFEIGIIVNANIANNYLSIGEIFQETIHLNLDNLANGLNLNLGFGIIPLYISFDTGKGWGFGLSTVVDAAGILGASGKLLSLAEATNEKSELSGALFASVGIDTFFIIKNIKLKLRPAMYYTLAYVKPNLSYTNNDSAFGVSYDIRVYEAFPLDSFPNNFELNATPGFDFSFGLEFPLSKALGLNKKNAILDFDIGLEFINIPIVPSALRSYTRYTGSVGIDDLEGINLNDFFSSLDPVSETSSGEGSVNIDRPFKMFFWVNWRPFKESPVFTITPLIGFSIDQLYIEPFSMEGGLSMCLNKGNIFLVRLGVNYMDRMWINSLNLAFNLRLFEIDIGVDIRSQDFLKSWEGGGLGLNVGLKFGW